MKRVKKKSEQVGRNVYNKEKTIQLSVSLSVWENVVHGKEN